MGLRCKSCLFLAQFSRMANRSQRSYYTQRVGVKAVHIRPEELLVAIAVMSVVLMLPSTISDSCNLIDRVRGWVSQKRPSRKGSNANGR